MEKQILQEFTEKGLTVRAIARELNTSYTNVRYWLHKYELKTSLGLRWGIPKAKRPRICGQCGETRSEKFYGRKCAICGACHNKYTIERGRIQKTRAVVYLGGKCKICGFNKFNTGLDIHHTDPKKKDPKFHKKSGWSWNRMKKELESCVLLCRNCHAGVHSGDLVCP